jgi:hypothetical protein
MRPVLIVGVLVVLAFGCGRREANRGNSSSTEATPQTARLVTSDDSTRQAAAPKSANDRTGPAYDTRPADQVVTLTGCLQGGEEVTTASATPAPPSASGAASAVNRGAADGSGANRFVLRRATPDSAGAGIGANGAGGSGGPLLAGVSDYALDGAESDLRRYLYQEVRVSARLNPRDTAAQQRGSANPTAAASSRSRAASTPASNPPATSASVAANTETDGGSATASPPLRRLLVDSVQLVARTCASR